MDEPLWRGRPPPAGTAARRPRDAGTSSCPGVAPLVRGAAEPLPADGRPARPGRCRRRGDDRPGRLPAGRDPRARPARQRPAGLHPRRQPPRLRPAHRPGHLGRGDARRPRADEAVRVQRRPDLALPERPGLPRPRPTSSGCTSSTRPTSSRTRSRARCATTRATSTRGSTACRGWSSATRTTRRSSSGRSATSPGYGANHEAAAAWLRRYDPTPAAPLRGRDPLRLDERPGRQRHHLPDVPADRGDRRPRPVRPAAPPADHVRVLSHAMGNSNGTLAEYWDAIESTPGLQGGFIWEFWDHGLVQTLPDGRHALGLRRRLRRRSPTTATSCCDGMVWPDRRPKPAMWEHQRLAAPVRISGSPRRTWPRAGSSSPTTSTSATSAGSGRATTLTVDGDEVAARRVRPAAIGPGERATVDAPGLGRAGRPTSGEAFLTVRFTTAAELPWAPAGFEVCAAAAAGRRRGDRACRRCRRPDADCDPCRSTRTAASSTRCWPRPPALSLWRAPTDNDRIGGMAARWATLGRRPARAATRRRSSATAPAHGRAHRVRRPATGPSSSTRPPTPACADGGIAVEETATLPDDLTDLARVGTVLEVVPGPEDLRVVRDGPARDVPRSQARRAGRHAGGRPSRTSTSRTSGRRRTAATPTCAGSSSTDAGGAGLRIELDEPRQVSVTHLRAADLAAATHDIDVVPVAETVVHLDAAHRGLGTASCGPDTLPEYLLGAGTYRWAWTLRDLRPS